MSTAYRPHQFPLFAFIVLHFISTLVAIIVGGSILFAGVRSYIHWSVRDATQEIQKGLPIKR